MQRLIARLILLFAVAGSLVPLALAMAAPAPHSCCVRNAAHHCHDSGISQLVVRDTSCCRQNCYRGVIPVRWAQAQQGDTAWSVLKLDAYVVEFQVEFQTPGMAEFQPTRGPPTSFIA